LADDFFGNRLLQLQFSCYLVNLECVIRQLDRGKF
jgi:hypothetical protein